MTSLAAEYPASLCEIIAEAYRDSPDPTPLSRKRFSQTSTTDPLATRTAKQEREAENYACIGGLRNPAQSIRKVPGWKAVGQRIREALDKVIDEHQVEIDDLLEKLGTEVEMPKEIRQKVVLKTKKHQCFNISVVIRDHIS